MGIKDRDYHQERSKDIGLSCPSCGKKTLVIGFAGRLYECQNCGQSYPVTSSVWLEERDREIRARENTDILDIIKKLKEKGLRGGGESDS